MILRINVSGYSTTHKSIASTVAVPSCVWMDESYHKMTTTTIMMVMMMMMIIMMMMLMIGSKKISGLSELMGQHKVYRQ